MLGKLNDKYYIILFANTVYNVAVLCTISVLLFVLLPQMKKEWRNIIQVYSK
jgi:competence protein ComGC